MNTPAKIMVVDDTPRNVKLLADLLGVKGYEVVTAASGQEALAKIDDESPDLVLLDVVMPGMSGYEVCHAIREKPATKMLPVVMVTALDPSQERVKGIEAGADDFLSKPINQAGAAGTRKVAVACQRTARHGASASCGNLRSGTRRWNSACNPSWNNWNDWND